VVPSAFCIGLSRKPSDGNGWPLASLLLFDYSVTHSMSAKNTFCGLLHPSNHHHGSATTFECSRKSSSPPWTITPCVAWGCSSRKASRLAASALVGRRASFTLIGRILRPCGMAQPAILGHIGLVEDVSGSERQTLHESTKVDERLHLRQLPQISIQNGASLLFL
jgi:hypothetical protein